MNIAFILLSAGYFIGAMLAIGQQDLNWFLFFIFFAAISTYFGVTND